MMAPLSWVWFLDKLPEKKDNFRGGPVLRAYDYPVNDPFFVNDKTFRNAGRPVKGFNGTLRVDKGGKTQLVLSHKRGYRFSPFCVNTDR